MSDGHIDDTNKRRLQTVNAVPPERVPDFSDLDEPDADDFIPVDASPDTELKRPPARRYQSPSQQHPHSEEVATSLVAEAEPTAEPVPSPAPSPIPATTSVPAGASAPVPAPVPAPASTPEPAAVPRQVPEHAQPGPPPAPEPRRRSHRSERDPYYDDYDYERERHPRRRHRWGVFRIVKKVFLLLIMVALFAGGFFAGMNWQQRFQPTISVGAIKTQIADCSELATATLQYNGLVHYENGDIPIVNQKAFNMTYVAEIRAGVDLSQASVSVQGNEIRVVLPPATVQSKEIKPESLAFFDQAWALFNWDSRDDISIALQQAQMDLDSQVEDLELIDTANRNAERAIRSLLAPVQKMNDGYRVVVETA